MYVGLTFLANETQGLFAATSAANVLTANDTAPMPTTCAFGSGFNTWQKTRDSYGACSFGLE